MLKEKLLFDSITGVENLAASYSVLASFAIVSLTSKDFCNFYIQIEFFRQVVFVKIPVGKTNCLGEKLNRMAVEPTYGIRGV